VFTGIVEATGAIEQRAETAEGLRLAVAVPFEDLAPGDSISVNGVCLTVEALDAERGTIDVFLATETVDRTYLGELAVGDRVNLERPLAADGRFHGHVVQGHVDGTASVTAIERVGEDWRFSISLPAELASYLVEKGSIAVDGISLTVADVTEVAFAVAIVPETYDRTTLSEKAEGEPVHLEVDVLAKYVERQLQGSNSASSDS